MFVYILYLYVCMHACIFVCTYIYVCMYVYAYIRAGNIAGVKAGDIVLDPCCGSGTVLFAALERGAIVRGLDVRDSFVARCRGNLEGICIYVCVYVCICIYMQFYLKRWSEALL